MRTIGLFLLALALAAPTLSADESYVIRLMRPRRVGDRYRLDAKGTDRKRQRMTVGGQPAGTEEREVSVHLIAAATVLQVDSASNPIRIEYRIETCQRSSQGKTEEVLPAGHKVIAVSRDGKTVFTSGGDPPLDAAAREALGLVISAHAPDSPSDDEIFGARDRKRVGDKWGINAAAAARNLSKNGVLASAADLDGGVQLVRVRTVGPVKALEISAHLRVKEWKVPAPEGTTVERAGMEADLTGLFPADPRSVSQLSDKLGIRMNVLMVGRKPDTGEKIEIDVSMEMTLENSYSPIPAEPKSQSRLDGFPEIPRLQSLPDVQVAIALNPVVTVQPGDVIAITNRTSCGGPLLVRNATGTLPPLAQTSWGYSQRWIPGPASRLRVFPSL